LEAVDDKPALVSKLLEWLSTPFRYGICRIYVGARLLRKWKSCGVDVDEHILSFLTRFRDSKGVNMENVYHVISELVRSQTFSVGRYLQWLMAKGATSSPSEGQTVRDLPCDVGLIAQLPISRLPEHVSNLRSTLLTRTGLSVSDETAMAADIKDLISQRLPGIFDVDMHDDLSLNSLPLDLTWTVKAQIGQWLRRGVAEHTRETTTIRACLPGGTVLSVSALTPDEFYSVRDILETFGDISMLADVLKCASSSDDSTVLASVADTTNYQFDSLSVIGATTDLFRKLVDSYAALKRFSTPSLDLMFSLIELGLRIPNELNTVSILRQDLSRMENKSVMSASSPVSDHIPDAFVNTDPLFREKLDQLLMSGNVMDEPTLDSVFNTLTKHLESDDGKANLSANDTCRYLAQLRSFQPKHFDGILARWVCGHLRAPDRATLLRTLPPLIGVGCVTIRSFLSLVRRLGSSSTAIPNAKDLPADLFELLVSRTENGKYLDLVSYRFQLAQHEFLSKNSEEALRIVCDAATCLSAGDSKRNDLETSIVTLLRELLVRNTECTDRNYIQKLVDQYPAAISFLRKALDLLLGVDSQEGNSVISEVEKLAGTTDDFSLPFCQLKLQVLFAGDPENEDRNSIVDAMFKSVVVSSRAHNLNWVDLVALMNPDAVRLIRERAEKEFFAIPLLEEPNDALPAPHDVPSLNSAKLYLTIIDQLASSIPESGTPSVASVLVEKMDSLLPKIITMQANFNNGEHHSGFTADQARANFERSLAFWFSALLRMVVLHRASFMQPASTLKINSAHEQSRLLISIFCIALSRLPGEVLRLFPGADYFPRSGAVEDYRPCPGILLQTHALDVAASLIDVFPDEIRHQCARFLKEKCPPFVPLQNDSRFLYLLGPMADSHAAALAQSASAPSPAASTSTPTPSPANFPTSGSTQQPATSSALSAGASEGSNCMSRLRLQRGGRIVGPYPIRPWELLEDAAPFVGVNDTAVNLGYFDARRVRV
jgi:mediator of RNA polymerase II transcription subunit 12